MATRKASRRIRSEGRLRSNRCEDAHAFRMPQARSIKPESEDLLRQGDAASKPRKKPSQSRNKKPLV
ncbi:MAG: hypothetical protein KJ798_07050 [Gammaproteobacteria bacterium]|nr:hypothetical protein [Gammaproteobacteria bacterium]MBU1267848.1 hypothetical protein [Gammaproteobacteria bacterium]MBU1530466.1 hypothetical protein [Gammaproteobacteria bacterium]MBU1780129.1 hypothetical protein [Gammaproteobacteria bacterium]MBU2087795.1 hypothetical protein [Gammaproteobacteria bacterium]